MTFGPHQVKFSGHLREKLIVLRTAARALGEFGRLARSMIAIDENLIACPTTWGDPLKHLDEWKVTLYHRIFDELHVEYSVHDTERIVWIATIKPIFNHPLRQLTDSED